MAPSPSKKTPTFSSPAKTGPARPDLSVACIRPAFSVTFETETAPPTVRWSKRSRMAPRVGSPGAARRRTRRRKGIRPGIGASSVLRHLDAPVVFLEPGHVVLLGHVLEEARGELRRRHLPGERLLVRLQEREERLVAQLLVESVEKVRPLVVEQADPDESACAGVSGDPGLVGQRDGDLVGSKGGHRAPVFNEHLVPRLVPACIQKDACD